MSGSGSLPWGGVWTLPTLVALAAAGFAPGESGAAARVRVTAENVVSQGIHAGEVELVLDPGSGHDAAAVTFYAAAVDGLAPPGRISALHVRCAALRVTADRLACQSGRLAGRFGEFGPQDTPVSILLRQGGQISLSLDALMVAGGAVAVQAETSGSAWGASVEAGGLSVAGLLDLAAARAAMPSDLSASGSLKGEARLRGRRSRVLAAEGSLTLGGLTFANEAGTLAAEQLAATLAFDVARDDPASELTLRAAFDLPSGQAYAEPVFVDFGRHPLVGEVDGRLDQALDILALHEMHLRQGGVGKVAGSARLSLHEGPALSGARLRLEEVDVGGALAVYAAPMLISTDFADLQGAGLLRGEVDVEDSLPTRLELDVEDVLLDSVGGSLSVEGLSGSFSWFSDALRNELAPQVDSEIFKSRLEWRSARLWGIEFGAASIPFTTTGRHFRLLDPVLLPVFDGGLMVETVRVRHAGLPHMYVRFDAEVRPISVALIGRALGWPEFSGTLAGSIPRLELADGLVTFGGNIEAQVFDGTVTLSELRMRDPLGQYPQLFADIRVDALDLEQITSTFEFGMITGRLSGYVKDLEMFDWMPVSFEARLYSTPGDRSPHRISQRAVSNLSSIGGGSGGSVAAALQSGFLRFFDSFRYDRLGLSCTLANDVCRMDGVEPAAGGYYIVKGAGLPRIDVIGNQRRVAWTRLVRQLGAVTRTSGPVIE